MPDSYMNIDGQHAITSIYCPAYGIYFSGVTSFEDETDQIYTKVAVEIPDALAGTVVIADYWTDPPVGQTKFATSNSFQTAYEFEPSSLTVYVNGEEVAWNGSLDPTVFNVNLPATDGYLWAEYTVVQDDAGKTLGDTRAILEVDGGVIAETVIPELDTDILIRARRAVTNLEVYLDMVPTPWIGGRTNTTRSGPSNILPGRTPVYAAHIIELQEAIQRIEEYFDTLVPILLPRYSFSEVEYTDVFVVQYLEEIFDAVQSIETVILDPTYYGG